MLHSLVTEYLSSPEYEKLAPKTKASYRSILDQVRERWSALQIVGLEDDGMVGEIFDWRDSMRNKPPTANVSIKILKTFLSWAMKRRKIKSDPAQFVKLLNTTNR